jgi:hypothetical protein
MKITIESTPELARANGLPVRVWAGTTERGTPILALITRVATLEGADASELERELSDSPTRVVDPSGEFIASPRWCGACLARYSIRRPATHVARDASGLEWFECGKHDPADNLAEVERVVLEPIAEWFARHELPLPGSVYRGPASQREPWASIIASKPLGARLRAAMAVCDGLEPQLEDPFHCAVKRIRLLLAETELAQHATGTPDRLTAAERAALAGLHRWLHSPSGDCALIEDAQDYHEQVETESPSECERLDVEERDCPAGDAEMLAAFDGAVVWDGGPVRAGRRHTEPGPVGAIELGGPSAPPLPAAVRRAILDDEHAGNDDAGAVFASYATRGAQVAWHARHAHPAQVELIASMGAPLEEPHRSAWLTGYRIAAPDGDESESPTLPDVGESEPFELTDGDRAYYRGYPISRAPETYGPRDRQVVAAIAAEDEAKAAAGPAEGEPR